jgi:hypothetical protein
MACRFRWTHEVKLTPRALQGSIIARISTASLNAGTWLSAHGPPLRAPRPAAGAPGSAPGASA